MHLVYPDPPLGDRVVQLREWTADDLECVREAGHDQKIPAGTTVPAVFTHDSGLAFIERQQRRITAREGIALAIVELADDHAVGHLWLAVRPQPGVLGIGYWVIPSARGRGIASCAICLAARWALRDLAAARIEAWVAPDNEPSLRALSSAGFVKEGVLRSFFEVETERRDMVVLSLIASDL
ncbi:MAG: GNAT family N-acetyltransferase [Solirubrobacteraceae bacterium]